MTYIPSDASRMSSSPRWVAGALGGTGLDGSPVTGTAGIGGAGDGSAGWTSAAASDERTGGVAGAGRLPIGAVRSAPSAGWSAPFDAYARDGSSEDKPALDAAKPALAVAGCSRQAAGSCGTSDAAGSDVASDATGAIGTIGGICQPSGSVWAWAWTAGVSGTTDDGCHGARSVSGGTTTGGAGIDAGGGCETGAGETDEDAGCETAIAAGTRATGAARSQIASSAGNCAGRGRAARAARRRRVEAMRSRRSNRTRESTMAMARNADTRMIASSFGMHSPGLVRSIGRTVGGDASTALLSLLPDGSPPNRTGPSYQPEVLVRAGTDLVRLGGGERQRSGS